jgi:hypothetical protein
MTPRRARIARRSPKLWATAPTMLPSRSWTSAVQRWSAATRAGLAWTAATSFCISSGPAWFSICGTWPRGAGTAISL